MDKTSILRRIRGAIGNGIVGGAVWTTLAAASMAVMKIAGMLEPTIGWLDVLGMTIRIGIFGGIASGAFALLLPIFYRRKRLADINWVKFGVVGGVVSGLFVVLFTRGASVLFGDEPVAWNLIDTDILIGTVFGAITAGGSLWLAQRAERKLPSGSAAYFEEAELSALQAGDEHEFVESAVRRAREDARIKV